MSEGNKDMTSILQLFFLFQNIPGKYMFYRLPREFVTAAQTKLFEGSEGGGGSPVTIALFCVA